MVPQTPFIFPGRTVLKNIDPFKNFDEKYVKEKLNFFTNGSLSLDFVINQNADNISYGEKQIISFVRALLSGSRIICLDEAVANIDSGVEHLFY